MTAENYHLKWDSHSTYLNSSVATLYKNEKYADVVLYSSNSTVSSNSSMPTVGIAAHKFILSSCSQFFSSIFETSPITNNGQFHIVLPPDLSHRAIQILVQYMYMGEATVSNDILSEVLKGGELLKIRGLCRTTSSVTSLPQQNRSEMMQTSNNATYNLISMPLSAGPTSVRYLVEQQSQTVSRGLTTSALPKSSPVIMKSTKPISTLSVPSTVNIGKLTTSSAISVNKHVAIDPGEKCYTQETSTVLREEPPSTCNEIGCNGCTRMAETPSKIILQRESQSHGDTNSTMCTKQCPEYVQQTASDDCLDDTPSNIYEPEIHLSNLTTEHSESIHNYSVQDTLTYTSNLGHPTATVIREGEIQHLVSASSPPPPTTTTHQVMVHETTAPYVSIKEEPSEWTAPTTSLHTSQKKTSGNTDFKGQKIKTEPPISTTSLNMEADACQTMSTNQSLAGNDFDSYFSCDICKKVCEDKASLLRHLETHAAAVPSTSGFSSSVAAETAAVLPKSSYVPKKRRRISQQENTSDHVCLQCDICNTRFETPQEWVRHMSTQHTEVELAIFNSKKDAEKNNQPSTSNHKKLGCNLQQHTQRVQALGNGSTNSILTNSTSDLCTSPTSGTGGGISDNNATGYLRSTLSPA